MPATSVVLTAIQTALALVNAAEPDVAAIIALFKNTAETLTQYLADADATAQADMAKIQGEETPSAPAAS